METKQNEKKDKTKRKERRVIKKKEKRERKVYNLSLNTKVLTPTRKVKSQMTHVCVCASPSCLCLNQCLTWKKKKREDISDLEVDKQLNHVYL